MPEEVVELNTLRFGPDVAAAKPSPPATSEPRFNQEPVSAMEWPVT